MIVSTKTRYAIRMLADISVYQDSGKVKIKDISSRQDISTKYLEQIVTILSKNGIVKGERGPQGGYRLTRPASDITVAEIVKLMEGDLLPGSDSNGDEKDRWTELGMWADIDRAVTEIMSRTTIQDVLDDAVSRGIMKIYSRMPEYYI